MCLVLLGGCNPLFHRRLPQLTLPRTTCLERFAVAAQEADDGLAWLVLERRRWASAGTKLRLDSYQGGVRQQSLATHEELTQILAPLLRRSADSQNPRADLQRVLAASPLGARLEAQGFAAVSPAFSTNTAFSEDHQISINGRQVVLWLRAEGGEATGLNIATLSHAPDGETWLRPPPAEGTARAQGRSRNASHGCADDHLAAIEPGWLLSVHKRGLALEEPLVDNAEGLRRQSAEQNPRFTAGGRSLTAINIGQPVAAHIAEQAYLRHLAEDYVGAARLWRKTLAYDPSLSDGTYNLACAEARLGHFEAAMRLLRRALKQDDQRYRPLLQDDPDLQGLRQLPGFRALLNAATAVQPRHHLPPAR